MPQRRNLEATGSSGSVEGGTSLSFPCPITGVAGWSQFPPVPCLFRPSSKLDLPAIDTPKTPDTPDTPANITSVRGTEYEGEPLSYPDCVDLARAVKYCSKSLIEGTWSDESTIRGRRPTFTPTNFESAKAFLRASVERVDNRRAYRSLSDTPVSSRPVAPSRMPTCHGCHGPMGQGQHQGSAPGKVPCRLDHSPYCRGGVIEDLSWRACPLDYIFDENIDLAVGPGFENSLNSVDFKPPSRMHSGPAYSTLVTGSGGGQQHLLGAVSRTLVLIRSQEE